MFVRNAWYVAAFAHECNDRPLARTLLGEPVVMIHGNAESSKAWSRWVPHLAAQFRVIRPDMPGFGGTMDAGEVMTMEAAADYVAYQMNYAEMGKAVVVGLSMGGYIALAFAKKYPHLLAGLVLANTRSGADDDAGKERRKALADRIREQQPKAPEGPPAPTKSPVQQAADRATEAAGGQPGAE